MRPRAWANLTFPLPSICISTHLSSCRHETVVEVLGSRGCHGCHHATRTSWAVSFWRMSKVGSASNFAGQRRLAENRKAGDVKPLGPHLTLPGVEVLLTAPRRRRQQQQQQRSCDTIEAQVSCRPWCGSILTIFSQCSMSTLNGGVVIPRWSRPSTAIVRSSPENASRH